MGAHNTGQPYKLALDKILKDIRKRHETGSLSDHEKAITPPGTPFDTRLKDMFQGQFKSELPLSRPKTAMENKAKKQIPGALQDGELSGGRDALSILAGYQPKKNIDPVVKAGGAVTESLGQALLALGQLASVKRGGPITPITGERLDRALSAADASRVASRDEQRAMELMTLQAELGEFGRLRDEERQDKLRREQWDWQDKRDAENRAYQTERDDRLFTHRTSLAETGRSASSYPEGWTRVDFEQFMFDNRMKLEQAKFLQQSNLEKMRQSGRMTQADLGRVPEPVVAWEDQTGVINTFDKLGAEAAFVALVADPDVYKYLEDNYYAHQARRWATLDERTKQAVVNMFIDRVPDNIKQQMGMTYDTKGPRAASRSQGATQPAPQQAQPVRDPFNLLD